mgnify:CR=1 FL=1
MYSINCKGKLLSLESPVVMGIINITPDSFYEGHLAASPGALVDMAGKMLEEGARILDIGGQSTRPGSERISAAEEGDRVLPVIESIHQAFPDAFLSVDTYQHEVAVNAIQSGVSIVNDISGGEMDPEMIPTVAGRGVPYICMHMQGTPETMQQQPSYQNVVKELLDYFVKKIDQCQKAGILDIIIDPGFGFGKTIGHNFQLLNRLELFKILDKPLLAGLSRKSTIYKTLGVTAGEALNGTTVLNTIALLKGASILRVHDVKQAVECIRLVTAMQQA